METFNTVFEDDPNSYKGHFFYKLEVLDNATNKKYRLIENIDKIWNTFIENTKKYIIEFPIEMPEDETEKLNAYYTYDSLSKSYFSKFIPEEFLVYIEKYPNVIDKEYGIEIEPIPNYLALKIDYVRDIENKGFEFRNASIVAGHEEMTWKAASEYELLTTMTLLK